jgi:hypothetical protein
MAVEIDQERELIPLEGMWPITAGLNQQRRQIAHQVWTNPLIAIIPENPSAHGEAAAAQ